VDELDKKIKRWPTKVKQIDFLEEEQQSDNLLSKVVERTAILDGSEDIEVEDQESIEAEIHDLGLTSRKKRATNIDLSGEELDSDGAEEVVGKKLDDMESEQASNMFEDRSEDKIATAEKDSQTQFQDVHSGPPRRRLRSPEPRRIFDEDDEDGELITTKGLPNQETLEEEEDEDDMDESGIGFRPTPSQRQIRDQKRLLQVFISIFAINFHVMSESVNTESHLTSSKL